MPAPLESPPAKALAAILHETSQSVNSRFILLDYRHERTFSDLWLRGLESTTITIAGQSLDWTDKAKQILIIGNDPPHGVFKTQVPSLQGIDFTSHFTATSWLAAWKVKFSPNDEEKNRGATEGLASIAVLDPSRYGTAHGVGRALQTILAAHGVNDRSLVSRVTVLNAPTLEAVCRWLSEANEGTCAVAKDIPYLRELLKSIIWNELTSNRHQHHALSNVLGAFLLNAEVGGKNSEPGVTQIQEYVEALFRTCGGKSRPHGPGTGAWIENNLRNDDDRIVLIDDMAEIWAGFVSTVLTGASNRVLTTAKGEFIRAMEGSQPLPTDNSLTGLPQRLQDFLKTGKAMLSPEDLIFSGTLTSTRQDNFILFLDLRLGLSPRFHRQLRTVGTALLSSTRKLAWLTDGGRAQFLAELSKGETDDTLLPRLISLIDPTLPIIIFSSTHRTEMIDPFRDYGNIITRFRKPILSGLTREWSEIVGELQIDLVSAMEQAIRIATVRRKIQYIETESRLSDFFQMQFRNHKAYHAEIYLDEGTGELAPVGGLIAVFEGETLEEAQARAQEFDDALVTNGIRYFHSHSIGPQARSVKNKGDECLDELKKTLDDLKPSFLGALRVRLKNTGISALPHSSTFEHFDQSWFGGLEAVLELLIGECLGSPPPDWEGNISLGVFVATRSTPPQTTADIEKARFRSGWETTNNLIQTFNRRDCWRIARGILEERKVRASLDRAVGIPLVYEKTPTGRSQRAKEWTLPAQKISLSADGNTAQVKHKLLQFHQGEKDWRPDYRALLYAADACLKKWGIWSAFLKSNAVDLNLDASLSKIAVSGRHLDNGRMAESLASFPLETLRDNRSMASLLASRLSPRLASMSRDELLQAFKETSAETAQPTVSHRSVVNEKSPPGREKPIEKDAITQRGFLFGIQLHILPDSVVSLETFNAMLGKLGFTEFISSFTYTSTNHRDARVLFSTREKRDQAYALTRSSYRSERYGLE